MPVYTDQISRSCNIPTPPKRIISTVPSQTELLHFLGLEEAIIAITKFCVHPAEWFQTKTRIGGTKQLNLTRIRELKPDLIIANKEENRKEEIEKLATAFPVWVSDVTDLATAYAMITEIGKITDREEKAEILVNNIQFEFDRYRNENTLPKPRTAYLIWKDPYMTVGGDTFIQQMLTYAGFENIFSTGTRYPVIKTEELVSLNCELLLLSSEPYPFRQKHIDEIKKILPGIKIILVNGELFSWYGSRLLHAPAYLNLVYKEATL